ncbi:MAG: anthranilate synthase component I [Rhodothermales bacterium]
MTFDDFRRLVEGHPSRATANLVIPLYRRLSADLLTPVSAFLTLRQNSRYSFLLESVEGGEKLARYSFLGKDPIRIVRAFGLEVEVEHADGSRRKREGNVFRVVQEELDRYVEVKISGIPRFSSGAVGYLGYDAVRLLEHLPDEPRDDLGIPDAVWCFYDTFVAFDHVKHQLILMADAFVERGEDPAEAFARAMKRIGLLEAELSDTLIQSPEPVTILDERMESNFEKSEYEAAVEKTKEYIYEGDIFQAVISQRFSMPFTGDRLNLYRALRQVNPSPYLFFLNFDDFALIGSSPEVLVRVEDGVAEVLPIAGTRPRGLTDEEDDRLELDLLDDPKERAEHLMLVDLGRNDLGRVCRYGSVSVDRYAYVERYSHVMHIVSSVSGELDNRRGVMDVLAACFPAGTVSGAPKVRAMEIIDELEPTKRGAYAGAVGHVDYSGNMDTCIAIRTMLVRDNRIYVQAGAGIVADSDPQREYEETVNKARALKEAILVAAEGLL